MPRVRDKVSANCENQHVRPGKEVLNKQLAIKPTRPVFGEVGNKIGEIKKNRSEKPIDGILKNLHVPVNATKKEKKTTNIEKSPVNNKLKPKLGEEKNKKRENEAYSTKKLNDYEEHGAKSKERDPLLLTEYVPDIYRYLRELEVQYFIKPNFLENHKSTPRMRCILVDWLVEAHTDLTFLLETLHLTISLTDRYLQKDKTVDRTNLQLVGVCALWIAAKYEEMYVPALKDLVFLADNAFTVADVIKMEQKFLPTIDWSLGRPLPIHFLKRYSKLAKVQPKEYVLGKYLLESALVHYEMCHVKPSLLAAAAICLSIAILNDFNNPNEAWTEELAKRASYTYLDLREIIIQFAQILIKQETSKFQTVRKKYADSKFYKISMHPKLSGSLVKNLSMKGAKKT